MRSTFEEMGAVPKFTQSCKLSCSGGRGDNDYTILARRIHKAGTNCLDLTSLDCSDMVPEP